MLKTKMIIGLVDEEGNIIVQQDLNVTWTINLEADEEYFNDGITIDTLSSVLADQAKIDMDKGVVKKMIEKLSKKLFPKKEKTDAR